MIRYLEINKAVVDILKANVNGVQVVGEDIKSGFEKPAFFIQLIPISEKNYDEYCEKNMTINLQYFPGEKTNLENLKMLDTLNSLFLNSIKIKDRTITLGEKKFEIADNTLKFKFNLEFTDDLDKVEINDEYILKSNLDESLGYTKESLKQMEELIERGVI